MAEELVDVPLFDLDPQAVHDKPDPPPGPNPAQLTLPMDAA